MRPAADRDQASEAMQITASDFNRHETTLGETKENDFFGRKTFRLQILEQFKQQSAAAFDSGGAILVNIEPRKAAVISVGGVHEEIVHPRQLQRARQPAKTVHAV